MTPGWRKSEEEVRSIQRAREQSRIPDPKWIPDEDLPGRTGGPRRETMGTKLH